MPTEIPRCANSMGGGCENSNVKLMSENEESWVFQCASCKCIQVVSKDGVKNRSTFEAAAKRRQQAIEMQQRWEKRKEVFLMARRQTQSPLNHNSNAAAAPP